MKSFSKLPKNFHIFKKFHFFLLQGSLKIIQTKMFSLPHLILTGLHMLQMTLAYFLMLIVMTYNSWLCGAVILGSTLGYFCFGWRKTSIVDVSDHCHWRLFQGRKTWNGQKNYFKVKIVWIFFSPFYKSVYFLVPEETLE